MIYAHLDHRFESRNPIVVISMGIVDRQGNFLEMELKNFEWKLT